MLREHNLVSKELLEVVGEHGRWATFDNLTNFRREADAAQAGKAPDPRQEDVDDEPLNVIICTPRHRKMGDKTWIARHSLQRMKGARRSWHKRQLRARDFQSSSGNWIRERPTPARWLDKDPTLECAAFCARG